MDSYRNWHPKFPVDLKNCHDEPIQKPGAIQDFGFLVAYEPGDGRIRAISANAPEWLPRLADFESEALRIEDFFRFEEMPLPGAAILGTSGGEGRRLVRVSFEAQGSTKEWPAVTYRSGDLQVLEIETTEVTGFHDHGRAYLANLQLVIRDLQACRDLAQIADYTANTIKRLTGFDRVMVYRYDHEWNGEVIAEVKEERLESFLGLHYPASDIPAQARKLYEKNWIRIIPTVHYQPVRLLPESRQEMDLSPSLLRSVSPIHIRYLRNMGVSGSMSISLMVDGKLWGLVACHHYSGRLDVPLELRLGCEALGQLISWHIHAAQSTESFRRRAEGEAALTDVLQLFTETDDVPLAAKRAEDALLQMFEAQGIVIRLGDELVRLGEVPGDAYVSAISRVLVDRSIFEPFVTSEARAVDSMLGVPEDKRACGFMALPLAPRHNYFLVCFRPEQRRTVRWAGNPYEKGERVRLDDPNERLLPRGSFALWLENHEGKSLPWSEHSVDLLKRFALLFMKIVIERKEIVEKSNHDLKALNQAKDEFVAVVSHELRTPLNAIIGWTELALSGEISDQKQTDAFRIIQRNARSQNQLIGDLLDISRILSGKMKLSVKNMRVSEVVEAVVLSFEPAARAKEIDIIVGLDTQSDSILGDPSRVQQVVWNLLSNAVKFSPKRAKIWVTVRREDSHIELEVKDKGIGIDPAHLDKIFGRFQQVDSSAARRAGGLGLGLSISKHIVELHGGHLRAHSAGLGEGSAFTAVFPISPVAPEAENVGLPIDDQLGETSTGPSTAAQRLKGEVILVVEDEPDASSFLETLIVSHGAKVFVANNGREALRIIEQHNDEIGIVLSDIGMPEMDGYRLVESIRASKNRKISSICTVALTAFGRAQDRILALRAGFDSYIAKPVMQEELLTVLESACKAKRR